MNLPESIRITEVGPRDGLQNEGSVIPVQQKVEFINALSVSGARDERVLSTEDRPSMSYEMVESGSVMSPDSALTTGCLAQQKILPSSPSLQ